MLLLELLSLILNLSGQVSISPSLLSDSFTRYRISVDSFPSPTPSALQSLMRSLQRAHHRRGPCLEEPPLELLVAPGFRPCDDAMSRCGSPF